jgi:hypothetical protein
MRCSEFLKPAVASICRNGGHAGLAMRAPQKIFKRRQGRGGAQQLRLAARSSGSTYGQQIVRAR